MSATTLKENENLLGTLLPDGQVSDTTSNDRDLSLDISPYINGSTVYSVDIICLYRYRYIASSLHLVYGERNAFHVPSPTTRTVPVRIASPMKPEMRSFSSLYTEPKHQSGRKVLAQSYSHTYQSRVHAGGQGIS